MDGSIIPTSLGVNPTITISMMTERCCRLLAEDAGWKIDYNSFKNFNDLKCP
jgi:cholesterol oxidase